MKSRRTRSASFGDVSLAVNVRDVFDVTADMTEEDVSLMQHILYDAIVANGQTIEDVLREQVNSDPRSARLRSAGLADVLNKIIKRIRDPLLKKEMGQKVLDYAKTKNDRVDLSNQEARMVYKPDDYGTRDQLSKKKKIDVGWTDHAMATKICSIAKELLSDKTDRP